MIKRLIIYDNTLFFPALEPNYFLFHVRQYKKSYSYPRIR